jgi:hypothetical protein
VKPKNKAWNYNVSHHGRYVCIASHSSFLVWNTFHAAIHSTENCNFSYSYQVGADIVDLQTRSAHIKSCNQYLEIFEKHLHRTEIESIKRHV